MSGATSGPAGSPAEVRRYRFDAGTQLHDRVVIGGSPLRLFRLGGRGRDVVEHIAVGDAVPVSRLTDALLDAGAIHPEPEVGPYATSDVTIVVPTVEPVVVGTMRTIVVDDAAAEPVPGATIRLPTNLGPAAARNAGAALVESPLVAFVDADVELPADWLGPLLPHFADPRVALVAPRVRSTPGPSRLARYERRRSPLDLGEAPARIRSGSRVSYVPAAALVARVDAVRAIGGFDESLRTGEDVDLVWRLDRAGWRCRYEPRSVVHHRPRTGWRAWLRQRVAYGSSAAPLARRHPGVLAPLRISGWSLATWALAALGRPFAALAIGVGSAAALVRKLDDVPARVAFRLAAMGNLRAGEQVAEAIRRAWWPILAVVALRSRRARGVLVAAALEARDPIRVVDDVAYSCGVWLGILRTRDVAPLVPDVSSWPGRRTRPAPTDAR
jgi:mycofactocin system glycosyltransferase